MYRTEVRTPQTAEQEALLQGNQLVSIFLAAHDTQVEILNFGATLRSFFYNGMETVLGFRDCFDYLREGHAYLGAVLAPFGGRLEKDGAVKLHGGERSGAREFWDIAAHTDDSVTLELKHDASDGYPGNRVFAVTYSIPGPGELKVDLKLTTDRETIANLSFHPYFNISKYPDVRLLDYRSGLTHAYPLDERNLPIFDYPFALEDTVFDITTVRGGQSRLARNLKAVEKSEIPEHPDGNWADHFAELSNAERALATFADAGGFDHYFYDPSTCELAPRMQELVKLYAPDTEMTLEVHSDAPGIVIYTGRYLGADVPDKAPRELFADRILTPYSGVALEAQLPPNGVGCAPWHERYVATPDIPFERTTLYKLIPGESLYMGPDAANFDIFDDPMDINF